MSNASYVADTTKRRSSCVHRDRRSSGRRSPSLPHSASLRRSHFGHYYLSIGRYLETTDDAYVKADSTIIAPKVSGYIAEVLVADNEAVKAGQLLAKIDDRDFRTALSQARADVAAANSAVKNLDAQITLQQPLNSTTGGRGGGNRGKPEVRQGRESPIRRPDESGSGTIQRAQQSDAALRAQTAQLQHGKAGLIAASQKIEVLATQRAQAVAQLDRTRAVEQQAGLKLSYTQIMAPVDGTVGARSLPGRPICPGRHAIDGRGAARRGLCGREFQGDAAHPVRNGQAVELSVEASNRSC